MRVKHSVKTDFEQFARENGRALVRAAYLLTGNRLDAEDLAQETLLKLYRHWRTVSSARNQNAYAYRALVNGFLSDRRRHRVRTESLDVSTRTEPVSEVNIEDEVGRREELAAAIATLSLRERTAVVLRHYCHLTHAEIADLMDVTESTARSTVSRGMHALRTRLEPLTANTEER